MADKVAEATANMIKNLEEKTGTSLAAWIAIVKKLGDKKHGEIVKHLKEAHALTHGYANLVAHAAKESAAVTTPGDVDLVADQYKGEKAALREIYDLLIDKIARFGTDVEIAPKKAYVSLRRARQFAIIQPSTKTRVDVGINLKGTPTTARLEASGSFNTMVTHRVRLESAKDVNAELIAWLKQAYDAAG